MLRNVNKGSKLLTLTGKLTILAGKLQKTNNKKFWIPRTALELHFYDVLQLHCKNFIGI